MTDVFSKQKRSEVMSRIRSRGNKDTELALAKLLRANKITGWRRHLNLRFTNDDLRMTKTTRGNRKSKIVNRKFAVRPDFVFLKSRTAIFVDGCFWHGCPRHGTQPKGNRSFWKKKFARNQARDRLVNQTLRRAGWRVLRIWEHDLPRQKAEGGIKKADSKTTRLLNRIRRALAKRQKLKI
jgi:DNA mismatch endonuclease (patch repair protein)